MAAYSSIMNGKDRLKLEQLSISARILATSTIIVFSLAMMGALAQIVVHDIIPTFSNSMRHGEREVIVPKEASPNDRGDLFGDDDLKGQGEHSMAPEPNSNMQRKPLLENEQFIWTLKWTHIHLFGMSMIFILMGPITLLLNMSDGRRALLVGLPFAGVVIDIGAMWLKNFVSPVFFWLHVPGGLMFGAIFGYVALRALWEMWGPKRRDKQA